MTRLTCVFLILLRLAIGWHFLFEGVSKIESPTWSSEPYLLESNGPASPAFRWMAGDAMAERYAVFPVGEGQDPSKVPPHSRLPKALDRDWNDYFERFAVYYKLDDTQRKAAEAKLLQAKDQTVRWMLNGKLTVKRESPWGPPVEIETTVPERLEEYQKKLAEARRLQGQEWDLFGSDVGGKVRTAKAEANKIRADLRRELDQRTREMKKSLRESDTVSLEQYKASLSDVLIDEQWSIPQIKQARDSAKSIAELDKSLLPYLAPEQIGYDPVPPKGKVLYGHLRWVPPDVSMSRLEWIDWLTKYGLFVVGVGLLAGLFTRTSCVLGAGFLLMFYLAMPPFPGLPENPKAEGHYFFINKNLIEMLALLTLATTFSGRWLGLDGLLQFLNPWRWKRRPVVVSVPAKVK
jgi:uncharacterized membrane protein YphA (DoxX/SURF4 family)